MSQRMLLAVVALAAVLLAGCGMVTAQAAKPGAGTTLATTTIARGSGAPAPRSSGTLPTQSSRDEPSGSTSSTTEPPRGPSHAIPRWCGMDKECAPVYTDRPDTGGLPAGHTNAAYCSSLDAAVSAGYALFDLRSASDVAAIKTQTARAVQALRDFAGVAQDPPFTAAVEAQAPQLLDTGRFGPGDSAALMEYLVPKANEISLLLQRLVNLETCSGR